MHGLRQSITKERFIYIQANIQIHGFDITQYHDDKKSNKIISHLITSTLHICAAYENIGGIGREYLTVKERFRCSCN